MLASSLAHTSATRTAAQQAASLNIVTNALKTQQIIVPARLHVRPQGRLRPHLRAPASILQCSRSHLLPPLKHLITQVEIHPHSLPLWHPHFGIGGQQIRGV
jgi:hypothetical protein